MKSQYLGDSKDSFKWDYLHFLIERLGYGQLKIAWMMTPDDSSGQGKTQHTAYPARTEILELCGQLRATRDPVQAKQLPRKCGAQYEINFHEVVGHFSHKKREQYFRALAVAQRELLFLDPDNGFKPDKSFKAAHVGYDEVADLLKRNPSALISVFHHFRHIKFQEDFAQIRERLGHAYASAIYWDGKLMFVNISSSQTTIKKTHEINQAYATEVLNRPNGIKLIPLP